MNMFKKNKKPKGQDDAFNALTGSGPEPTTMVKAHRALTRKKKKIEVVEDTTFDLALALPDSNEFRTSLLMPNLSARFSMLREQDDPKSLIGKASDDSVLFPKRASRINLFHQNYLSDIAEVESIRSSFRPPFADDRATSMSDGYNSDDGGSMLNRSRPGEGNNLFGGRQKLYKITTGSSKNLPGEGGITRGKHTYENDVALSAFQQLRLREKQQREQDEATDRSSRNTEPEELDSGRSATNAFSQNRGTQSSTNSGPSARRTSTAATSVVSESPVPQPTTNHVISKVKEIDANSSAESIGFASSPGFRKIHDDIGRSSSALSQSRSTVSSKDNYGRQQSANGQSNLHRMSPPPSATIQPLEFGLRDTGRPQPAPSRFQTASPTIQSDFGQDETLASNVRPNDRGKATAMGLFNKPSNNYDDAQFQQRQVQMHGGRDSPFSVSSRAASRASPDPRSSHRPSYASVSSPVPQDDMYTPQVPPIPDYSPSPTSFRRSSAASNGRRSSGSRPRTKSSASSKEASVQARVQSLIRKQNAELAAMEENHLGPSRSLTDPDLTLPSSPEKETEQPGFDLENPRDSASRARRPSNKSTASSTIPVPPLPPTDIHPAFRDGIQDFDFGATETRKSSYSTRYSNYSSTSRNHLSVDPTSTSMRESTLTTDDNESITSPAAGLGLVGLIRTHFRHDSDRSSMLPPPSPAMINESSRGSVSSTTKTVTESVKSDPFEFDNDTFHTSAPGPAVEAPPTPTMLMSQRAQQMLANAAAIRDAQVENKANKPNEAIEPEQIMNNVSKDEADVPSHTRSESTETTREQQRFDEELAERRRRIQEKINLKSVQERSRSRSPEADRNRANQGHGFSLPRFPGRSNTGDKFDPLPQSKAMKMLGISATRDQPSPRMPGDSSASEFDHPRNTTSRQGRRPTMGDDYDQSSGRQTPNSRPGTRSQSRTAHDRPGPPRSTTPSSRPNGRGRSNSAAADRSASRNKSIPDHDRAKMPGAFPASPFLHESPQNEFGQRTESPAGQRPYERSASSAAGNYQDRSNYFNSKSLAAPGMNGDFTPRPSPRPSPNPGEAIVSTQLMAPMSPPSSAMPSPNMINGRTTPTASSGRITPSRDRKRSVTKHMISEPTFVSSTSTVPLVHLPRDGGPPVEPLSAPPVPAMNPRRRGNTGDQMQFSGQSAIRPLGSPLPVVPASPVVTEFQIPEQPPLQPVPQPRARNKLRKSSSEGGNMAARARHQALIDEMAREKDKSPSVAVFPNKSATSLYMAPQEGGMF